MPIDSHLPQADPFSLVPTFKEKEGNSGEKGERTSGGTGGGGVDLLPPVSV
jgi:hypothetical protein